MKNLVAVIKHYWAIITSPSRHFSLGFLVVGAFVAGIVFWGGFNTAMELTNTETFCKGCHEMGENVYPELQRTIHYTNRSGVRAVCSNCHVPHNWTHKIARKMQASKEVWGKLFGTIDTREKFLDKRLELAKASFEAAIQNMRELAEVAGRSNREALEVINQRALESFEEIKQALARKR